MQIMSMVPQFKDSSVESKIRLIAFYLPQYHPIPENNEWWGKGFTEWTNVAKARPLFKGHYQPHIPADLGFYDLRLPEARDAQANLARQYGIYGFCYYHYWFNGKRLLERPFNDVLISGKPDFPFCLCWANENWTRVWDGGNYQVLLAQEYNEQDDIAHIQSLIPIFKDPRYIKIDGRPLLLVYRVEKLLNPIRTAEIWKKEVEQAGLNNLYLVRVESVLRNIDPITIGFDAAVEFAPDWRTLKNSLYHSKFFKLLGKFNFLPKVYLDNWVIDYQSMINYMISKPEVNYIRYRCVCPSFDNSPRRKEKAAIYLNSTPEKYEKWLSEIIKETIKTKIGEKRIVFINAWNEWGEGNHLEPDLKWRRKYLEATLKALNV